MSVKAKATSMFTDRESGKSYVWGQELELTKERAEYLAGLGKVVLVDEDGKPIKMPSNIPSKHPQKTDKNVETQGDKAKGDKLKDNDEFHTKKDVKPQPQKK